MKKIKIAVVGAGNMASEHIKAFSDIADVEIVAITSRNIERAEKLAEKYKIGAVCKNISEMYEQHKPEGLIIAVPELETYSVLSQASLFPWSILAEKPVGYNYEQANQLFNIVQHRKDSIFVALNRRHYSSTREVLRQINAEPGERVVVVNDQEDSDSALAEGRPVQIVENWMYANSIHLIDYFTIFCRGEVENIKRVAPWKGLGTEIVVCEIEYSSGDKGVYLSYWNRPHPWIVSISSKNRWWEVRPIESAAVTSRASRIPTAIEKNEWDIQFKPGMRRQAEEFVNHLKTEEFCLPTIRQSLVTMELVRDLYEA